MYQLHYLLVDVCIILTLNVEGNVGKFDKYIWCTQHYFLISKMFFKSLILNVTNNTRHILHKYLCLATIFDSSNEFQ